MDYESLKRNPIEESEEYYIHRIQKRFPNFPDDVIQQWFIDHPQAIEDYSWLDFNHLTFNNISLPTKEIPGRDCDSSGFIESNVSRFETVQILPRFVKLVCYFRHHKTWPRPVIFLNNPNGTIHPPYGDWVKHPMHLIEGHGRMTVFHAYLLELGAESLKSNHEIWLMDS